MHWLSQNYQWIFSGIGVLILALLLERWRRRAKLKVEIREVCFDDVLQSVANDWSDFTVERYIFVRVWAVNLKNVPTTVKEWKLTYSKDKKVFAASEVSDFSKWRQHVKWKVQGTGFVTGVIQEAHNTLTQFPLQPLQHGVPSEGWVCFKATGVSGMGSNSSTIKLEMENSLGQKYRVNSPAPSGCKGTMTNPDLPW
jgi:hypothetical protein